MLSNASLGIFVLSFEAIEELWWKFCVPFIRHYEMILSESR
jgi:hypothetical protein